MRIARARIHPYALTLRRPWRSARGMIAERQGLLVELTATGGLRGYGDSAPLPEAGSENLPTADAWLQGELSRLPGATPEQALARLPPPSNCPAARCGLETALLDLQARQRGLPLARLLNPSSRLRIPVNASLGALDESVAERAAEARAAGYGVMKVKLGVYPHRQELARLQRLAELVPDHGGLRLDANRAWSESECRHWLPALADLPVESLEEPLRTPDPRLLADLQAAVNFSLALDESLPELGLSTVLANPPVRRLVLKPMMQGGLLPCLQAARRAPHLEWVVTTSVDSAAGTWATAQLAAALGSPLAQGLATSDWLGSDLGPAPPIDSGWLQLPDRPGSGFRWETIG